MFAAALVRRIRSFCGECLDMTSAGRGELRSIYCRPPRHTQAVSRSRTCPPARGRDEMGGMRAKEIEVMRCEYISHRYRQSRAWRTCFALPKTAAFSIHQVIHGRDKKKKFVHIFNSHLQGQPSGPSCRRDEGRRKTRDRRVLLRRSTAASAEGLLKKMVQSRGKTYVVCGGVVVWCCACLHSCLSRPGLSLTCMNSVMFGFG